MLYFAALFRPASAQEKQLMNIDTAVIRAEPHAELASVLKRNARTIIDRWCRLAQEKQPSAKRVHYIVLRDELPAFLETMAQALEADGRPDAQPYHSAREHGEQRWENGWSVTELVRDYQLLRLVILESLEENLGRPVYYREAMAVGVFIDDAVGASVARYVAARDDDVLTAQRERLEAVADLSRRKDEFLAILGHELRNPLAPIRNSIVILRKLLAAPHAAVASSIDVLDRQSNHLCRLVDDLLDLARISRGEFELRKSRFDVRSAVEQALQVTEPLIASRNHRLVAALPAVPLFLEADPNRITQVVANLLTNAAKYTKPGGMIRLSVAAEAGDIVISVSDNGVGIAPEMLSRVFELFARIDQPQTEGVDGLGIGLTLVQRLIQQHGGSITAHSGGLGLGSEFVVRLAGDSAGLAGADAEPLLVIRKIPSPREGGQ
jgi:signal transduction histidine kinase